MNCVRRAILAATLSLAALASARAESCEGMPPALDDAFADASDCALIQRTLMQALATGEDGAVTRWINVKSGSSGTIKLAGTEKRDGTPCRRVELTVGRTGEPKRANSLACIKGGRWTIVE